MNIFPYLNFDGETESAFLFYQAVFGGEFEGGIKYMRDAPGMPIEEDEMDRVMHVCLRLSENVKIIGSDNLPSMGHVLKQGNHAYLSLDMDSKEEGERIFRELSEGGEVEMAYQKTFWGAYFASFKDRFGVSWMINYDLKAGEE
ncbi:VOC family protein [Algoriphagus sp. CAU 1675]|uniref:VOC family protein n=1 Tax=Algoriphagus sp. CAU 1675 TaxID=3032597 RepID=UPI0023D9D951|nr:VOC family protein [Algoriphagus sp. CAU 1675]MDF2157415.1 VOC family protein [Algoriphagus sp. CAU 1675]